MSAEGLKNMINFKKSASPTTEKASNSSPTSSPTSTSASKVANKHQQPTGELSLSNFVVCSSPKDPLSSNKTVPIVYSEDNSSDTKKNEMEAMAACTKDDVLFRNWVIRFINSQMLLKGKLTFLASRASTFHFFVKHLVPQASALGTHWGHIGDALETH